MTEFEALECPTCRRRHPARERFCADCGMPLVHVGQVGGEGRGAAADEARDYARRIRPEFARGELVRVAGGRNQAEAELIRNLLIEEGVPSMLRRSAGFDVPDFLAAGERDVLVPGSGAEHAREILYGAELAEAAPEVARGRPTPHRAATLAGAVLGAGALAAAIAWVALRLAA